MSNKQTPRDYTGHQFWRDCYFCFILFPSKLFILIIYELTVSYLLIYFFSIGMNFHIALSGYHAFQHFRCVHSYVLLEQTLNKLSDIAVYELKMPRNIAILVPFLQAD